MKGQTASSEFSKRLMWCFYGQRIGGASNFKELKGNSGRCLKVDNLHEILITVGKQIQNISWDLKRGFSTGWHLTSEKGTLFLVKKMRVGIWEWKQCAKCGNEKAGLSTQSESNMYKNSAFKSLKPAFGIQYLGCQVFYSQS